MRCWQFWAVLLWDVLCVGDGGETISVQCVTVSSRLNKVGMRGAVPCGVCVLPVPHEPLWHS